MKILAVDTSGFGGSVACSLASGHVQERPLSTEGRRHAQTLVLEVQSLLQSVDLKPSEIDSVAVSIGPGSFTGLRVGVVFAKTFAWANSCSLVAVDTFQAIAQRLGDREQPIAVVSDAQRQEVFLNTYDWDVGHNCAKPRGEVRIEPVGTVTSTVEPSCLWTGPGVTKFSDHFADTPVADQSLREPSAASVAQVGRAQLAEGVTHALHDLEPLYIRRSYAEENAARKS